MCSFLSSDQSASGYKTHGKVYQGKNRGTWINKYYTMGVELFIGVFKLYLCIF